MARVIQLGKIRTQIHDDFLVLAFSKKWFVLNENEPIEFDVELTKEGKLVLSGSLARLDKTKKVIDNVI